MNIMNDVIAYFLTEEEIQMIKLNQRARRLEPNLSDIEAEEMWHLLHEEPDYADEILDSYEKLVRDRRIQRVIGHLPEEEGYMTENAVYVIPEWADEILNDWGDDDDQDDDD